MEFELTTSRLDGGIVCFTVTGELDLATAPELKKRLEEVIVEGSRRILLDLTDATFLDSTTLGVLMGTVKRLDQVAGALVIVCDNPNILTIFEITEFDAVLNIFDSMGPALALLQDLADAAASDDLTRPVG
jgi:anti-sigma B factor antagonist